jgi:DNA-binding response OmpR family regulator
MPNMHGAALYEELKKQRPELPVLFMSGYTIDALAQVGIDLREAPLLAKPFTIPDLIARVREMLAPPPPQP